MTEENNNVEAEEGTIGMGDTSPNKNLEIVEPTKIEPVVEPTKVEPVVHEAVETENTVTVEVTGDATEIVEPVKTEEPVKEDIKEVVKEAIKEVAEEAKPVVTEPAKTMSPFNTIGIYAH